MDLRARSSDTHLQRIEKKKLQGEIDSKRYWDTVSGMTGGSIPLNGDWSAFRRGRMMVGLDPYTGAPTGPQFTPKPPQASPVTYYPGYANPSLSKEKKEISVEEKIQREKEHFTAKLENLLKKHIENDNFARFLTTPKYFDAISKLVVNDFPYSPEKADEYRPHAKEINVYNRINYAVQNNRLGSVMKNLNNKSPRQYYNEWEAVCKKMTRSRTLGHIIERAGGVPLIALTTSTLAGIFAVMTLVPGERSVNKNPYINTYTAHTVTNAPSGVLMRSSPVVSQTNIVGFLTNGQCVYTSGALSGEWAEVSRTKDHSEPKTYVTRQYLKRSLKPNCP